MAIETEFCVHYQAMSEHDACKVGIRYDIFKGLPFDKRPCFEKKGKAPPGCHMATFPTQEERAARDEKFRILFEGTMKARETIVAHLGGPWKKGTPSAGGSISCPLCKGIDTLRFSRAGYDGHIHAKCVTKGCVSWME